MKILFVLTYYYPHWTGLTQYARRLAEGLVTKGHTVSVLTTKHDDDLPDEETISGVQVFRKPVAFRLSRSLFSPVLLFSLRKYIKRNNRVIVYLPFAEALYVSLVSKLLGKKLYFIHNGDLVLPKGFLNRILEKVYYSLTYWAIRLSSGVVVQTQDYAESSKLLIRLRDKITVILPLFESMQPKKTIVEKFRKRLLFGKTITVGFAGRFVQEKGFDILLDAIPLIRERIPSVQFVFAGETHVVYERFFWENRQKVNAATNHLTLLGKLSEEEMAAFYSLCDIFVVPSRTDCFPSVAVEALLSGVPVVVSDTPGARWATRETNMGKVVPRENPQALAEGICEVFHAKQNYLKYKKRAHEIFNYDKTLYQYETLFKK